MSQPIFQTASHESILDEDGRLARVSPDNQTLRRAVLKALEQVAL